MSEDKKLLFIYNADSDVISVVKDFWKKILRPSSYQCNLCQQTFGTFSIKKDWKKFINSLDVDVEFLHKDEFEKEFNDISAKYPSAYLKQNGDLKLLITQDEMNAAKSLDEMEELVLSKIKNL